jgi:hypothetical protein
MALSSGAAAMGDTTALSIITANAVKPYAVLVRNGIVSRMKDPWCVLQFSCYLGQFSISFQRILVPCRLVEGG